MKAFSKFLLLGFFLFSSSLILAQTKLLAPVFPGSVISPLRGDKTESIYLSKDQIEKIKSFYDSKVGTLTAKDPITKTDFMENLSTSKLVYYGKTIITGHEIIRRRGYPGPGAKDAGVLLVAKSLSKENENTATGESTNVNVSTGNSAMDSLQKMLAKFNKQVTQAQGNMKYSKSDMKMQEMSDLFDGLKNEVFMQRHTKQELFAVYNKYKFLDASFYPLVKDKNGEEISYAQNLLHEYQNKLGKGSMMSDQWNYWMGFLKKLAPHAYKTLILINTEPSTWEQ